MQPILRIDLSSGEVEKFVIPEEFVRGYLGAASLAARLLFDMLTPDLDPLSPKAVLLFLNGPLTGTAGPAVGRFIIAARSPATGLWGEANVGGFWGPELRKAGYDGLWITGRAADPVYIWIRDGEVEVRDASHLWGLDTYQTQSVVIEESGQSGTRVATIGTAGEAAIPYSLILCDHGRVAGRTGMGAVMGAKNLKAVAVRGTQKVPVVNWEAYNVHRGRANRELREDNQSRALLELGSAGAADYFDYLGEMPKKYFHSGVFEGAEKVTGAAVAESILDGVSTCHACVIACGRVVHLPEDAHGKQRKGPEYETMVGFGPNLLIDELSAITVLGELCDRLGMDSISLSNTIGLAFSLFEKGIISERETNGMNLKWGDVEIVEQCVRLTAKREGFGAFLAQGARGLALRFGAEEEAVQVNGLEVPFHDPRGASGMALSYVTSPRGACHNQSDYFMVDVFGQAEESLGVTFHPRHAGAEKAESVARHQDWHTVLNSLVLCYFANVPPDTVLELTNLACGLNLTMDELLGVGERAWNLKRVINHRLGLRRAHDKLPNALLIPYSEGGSAGFAPNFESMLAAYYRARDWDPVTGQPTEQKMRLLGLGWVS